MFSSRTDLKIPSKIAKCIIGYENKVDYCNMAFFNEVAGIGRETLDFCV